MPGQVPALPTLRTLSREVSPVRRLRASGRAFACPTGAPGRGPAASAVPSAHTASWRQNFLGAGGDAAHLEAAILRILIGTGRLSFSPARSPVLDGCGGGTRI